MRGCGDETVWPLLPRTRAQVSSLSRTRCCVAERPAIAPRLSPEAALKRLLHTGAACEEPARPAPFARYRVSLPRRQVVPASPADLPPDEFAQMLGNFRDGTDVE